MNTLEKIKFLRKSNKYTQEFVAKNLGTSAPNYSRYESGERKFTIDHIKNLAKLYNVSLSYLLDDNSNSIAISQQDFEKLKEAKNVIEKIENALPKNE